MATFGIFAKKKGDDFIDHASPSLLVAGASYEEEKPYWNTTAGKPPQQQQGRAPAEEGTLLAKLPGIEIGTTLVNDIGDLAKNLGDQASQNTTELVTGALKAYTRLKGKVVSAVDGVGHSAETKRETTEEAEACWGLQPDQEEDDEEELEEGGHEEGIRLGTEQGSHSAAAGPSSTKVETSADASAANLQAQQQQKKKKAQAQLEQVAAGGAEVVGGGAAVGVGAAVLTKPLLSDYDAAGHNRGGGAGGAGWAPSAGSAAAAGGGGLKILPRTASLVGGKGWAILSAVCDAAVAAVDETVGDML